MLDGRITEKITSDFCYTISALNQEPSKRTRFTVEADRESTESPSHLISQSQTALKFTVRATDVECLLMADGW